MQRGLGVPLILLLLLAAGCAKEDEGRGSASSSANTYDDEQWDDNTNDDRQWDKFVAPFAHAYCDLREDCDPTQFATEFENDEEVCKRSVVTNETNKKERNEDRGCEFDPDQGSLCINAAQEIGCQEWVDGGLEEVCNGVWVCP